MSLFFAYNRFTGLRAFYAFYCSESCFICSLGNKYWISSQFDCLKVGWLNGLVILLLLVILIIIFEEWFSNVCFRFIESKLSMLLRKLNLSFCNFTKFHKGIFSDLHLLSVGTKLLFCLDLGTFLVSPQVIFLRQFYHYDK